MAISAALMAAGRVMASQGLKQGAKTAAKNFAKEKVKDIAKKKAQSFIQNKNKDKDGKGGGLVKRDSGDGGGGSGGFFGGGSGGSGGDGGSGGPIVQTKRIDIKKLSLIDKEETSSDQKKFDGSELIDELTKIKNNLITIKKISSSNLSRFLDAQKNIRRAQEFSKRKNKEDNLEATKEKTKKPKSIKGIKGPGFLDLVWGYITNVLLGSLAMYLLRYVPQILKMFEEIADGLTNVWQRVRLAIISASVLFRKQIRFVFNLGRKILKFATPLIKKAGSVVKKVLTFAGQRIVNLIKGAAGLALKLAKKVVPGAVKAATPIVKGAAKVAGKVVGGAVKAGGVAAKAAGNAVNVVKRVKFISNLFKKVPFVGALIGIGIDLAMGERLDKAIAGAAGASLGTAIGGAIGTGLIPIPVVGTWVGGVVGGAIGDWAGKQIYSNLIGLQDAADKEAPVEQKYAAGRIGQGSISGVRRNSSTSSPGTVSTINSKVSPAIESGAKKNIFKDEETYETYNEIRNKLGSSSFVGELMQIGLDAGLGQKISKTRTDNAAKQIGSSVGKSLSESDVFGFNKRLVEPLTENVTNWAKKSIFNELTRVSLNNVYKTTETLELDLKDPTVSSERSTGSPSDGGTRGTGGTGGTGGTVVAGGAVAASELYKEIGANAEQWDIFRNSVAYIESKGDYKIPGGSGMHYDGRYQMGEAAKKDGSRIASVPYPGHSNDPNAQVRVSYRNNPELQETIFTGFTIANHRYLMRNAKYKSASIERKLQILGYAHNQGMGGAEDWLNTGQVGADGFGTKGTAYTDLIAKNFKAKKSGGEMQLAKGAVLVPSSPGTPSPDTKRSSQSTSSTGSSAEPGSPKNAKSRKIFLHWSAGNYNTPYSAYHTTILGDGKRVQNTPYDQDKSGHTAGGNTNSIGLAVAAAAGASENDVKTPPTSKQLDVMTSEAAKLAKGWGWTPASVDSNVKTHGEWERYAVPAGILSPPVQRWDLDRLSNADKFGTGGPKLRDMIKSKLSAMGGGGDGNGGPIKKHKISKFIMGGNRVLTSGMGVRDFALSPGMHMGVDIAGTTGEPLQAFTDGVVEDTGYRPNGYGYYVSWIDDQGIGHFYAHMNKPAFVKKGQKVKKGTILGELGSTGRSSGPHLHWEVATNPSDTGRSKSAVLSRFNPLSRYGIDSPFGGNIQPDPSIASDSSSSPGSPGSPSSPGSPGSPSSPDSPDSSSKSSGYDISWDVSVEASGVQQRYLDALESGRYINGPANVRDVDSLMEETSYEQGGGNNIIMMPMSQGGSSSAPPVNGRVNKSGGSLSAGVNSNMDIYNKSLKQVIVSAFYKI